MKRIFDAIIHWSILHRAFVLVIALAICVYGAIAFTRMPVDVFPDLTAPTVTIVTEAHGLAPEEVESLITAPIEAAMNGQTQVRRVRSASGVGISIIWVEFGWETEMTRARQLVNEKLPLAQTQLPPGVPAPQLAPVSSVMGEIMFVGLRGTGYQGYEIRDAADWIVRRRLVALQGVAQVVPIGGGVRQYQVEIDPDRLRRYAITFDEVAHAIETSNQNSTGGFAIRGPQQSLVRGLGRLRSTEDLRSEER